MYAFQFVRKTFKKPILLPGLLAFSTLCSAQESTIYGPSDKKDTVTSGFKPNAGSDRFYRIYVGAAYNVVKYRHNKVPYAASHSIGINYSITENSFHPFYEGLFPQAIGQWGLSVKAGNDGIRRTSFYGLGNETKRLSDNNRFNWVRTHHQYADVGISRLFSGKQELSFGLLYDGIQVLNDENRFIAKNRQTIDPEDFKWQNFLSGRVRYTYSHVDNTALPTRGLQVTGTALYTESLKRRGHSFTRYTGDLDAYLPLSPSFTYIFRTGLATLTGRPDFYQYNTIGGTYTLRGYDWYRFYGKTSFYNQNELRWLRSVEIGTITGKFGLMAFYDLGRVWQPGESSGKMHYGYGLGLILAPMDRVVFTLMYGISNEDRRINTILNRLE